MALSFDIVQNILNCEDVEGLLTLGAPKDEYHSEAQTIWEAIERGQTAPQEEDLNDLLCQTWQNFFGPFSKEDMEKRGLALRRIARQLAEAFAKRRIHED